MRRAWPPSLAAMMVSKLTSGVQLETVRSARFNSTAAALVSKALNSGAMGAAGIPRPDKATIDSFVDALAFEAAGADLWHVANTVDLLTNASIVTASIARELPSAARPKETATYRLAASCNAITHEGQVLLAWAPGANGKLSHSLWMAHGTRPTNSKPGPFPVS